MNNYLASIGSFGFSSFQVNQGCIFFILLPPRGGGKNMSFQWVWEKKRKKKEKGGREEGRGKGRREKEKGGRKWKREKGREKDKGGVGMKKEGKRGKYAKPFRFVP